MNRRRFVATTGIAVASAGLAGCVADDDNTGAGPGNDDNGDGTGTDNGDDDGPAPAPDLDTVDQPPHDPERPPDDGPDDWVETWKGHGMEDEPSIAFESMYVKSAQSELTAPPEGDGAFAVTVIETQTALEERFENPDDLEVSFEEETVIHVESGWGSSSVNHVWVRVESTTDGIHLHGYYTDPTVRTHDYTTRESVVVVEKPAEDVETVYASLTVDKDIRVNIDSDEGVVEQDTLENRPPGTADVDTPPHNPTAPERPDPGDAKDWDEEWLGDGMATHPSLALEREHIRPAKSNLSLTESTGSYAVTLIDSQSKFESWVDAAEELDVSFDESVLIHVESGWGSGSINHRWARVEAENGDLHLHGYYTDPLVQTDDYTSRHSVLVVEKPAEQVDSATVSLTVDADTRVTFNSGQGPVDIDD